MSRWHVPARSGALAPLLCITLLAAPTLQAHTAAYFSGITISPVLRNLTSPFDVKVDNSGNVYVAGGGSNAVYKIVSGTGGAAVGAVNASSDVISLGSGTSATFTYPVSVAVGSNGDGERAGTVASFFYPMGQAVDGAGNIYVADYENDLIRKVTPQGVVTTFAGSGGQGGVDGIETAASFHHPYGLAVDGAGNVSVADGGGNSDPQGDASGRCDEAGGQRQRRFE